MTKLDFLKAQMKKISEYKIIGIYFLAFVLVISIVKIFFIPNLLSTDHFLNWDAIHYFTIKNKGYDTGFIVAFFPLFPLVWKGLHVGVYGIVLFNAFLFLTSFYFLIKNLNLKLSELLLYLSIPSFLFFYLREFLCA